MSGSLLYPELHESRVLVTGCAHPEGVALAASFADHGCRLVLELGPAPQRRSTAAEGLRKTARSLRVLGADFHDEAGVDRFADAALKAYGGIDVLVSLIRLPTDLRRARSQKDIMASLERCLMAPQQLTRRLVAAMRQASVPGAVVNVMAGDLGEGARALALHAFAKTALEGLTRIEARAAFSARVRVYGLIEARVPGERHWPDLNEACGGEQAAVAPDSLQDTAVFLASNRGRWLNGAVLAI